MARAWTATAPTDGIDFDLLAQQFRLSGGNIRNVGLTASFSRLTGRAHARHACVASRAAKLGTALAAGNAAPPEIYARLG